MRFFKLSFVAVGLASALLLTHTLTLANIPVMGQTYPIAEEDAVESIHRQLRAKQKSGELATIQKEAVTRSLNSIKQMPPVAGLVKSEKRKARLIDPTVTYEQAVLTDEGKVVVPAGAKINPLLVTRLSKRLVFFDGRDAEQREAVGRMVKANPSKIKVILVGGSWLDLSKQWKTQVYFDQQGVLVKRFGITHVPTIITQQGANLLLEEFSAKELK